MIRLRSYFLFLLFLGTSLAGMAQYDCGCDPARSWEDDFEKANVVVLATCMGVRSNPIKGGMNVVFQIDSSWKRKIEPVATIHTEGSNQCGYLFETGKRYLIFANKRHQTVETSICEHNQLWEEVDAATRQQLGPGFGAGRPEMSGMMNKLLLIMGVASVLFVGLIVLRKRIFGRRKA